ncbi:hypothetical protein GCM10027570_50950 [Streptomonospora sediminis]
MRGSGTMAGLGAAAAVLVDSYFADGSCLEHRSRHCAIYRVPGAAAVAECWGSPVLDGIQQYYREAPAESRQESRYPNGQRQQEYVQGAEAWILGRMSQW